ncbi:MAG: glycolate oxidase subunit GlcE [Variibacter sp.]|nr:glycolate oxidase subunit GlcE [Variibacter sp.]
MADAIKPREATEVREAVEAAIAEGKTLEVVGQGSKRAIGRAAQWDLTLDLSGLSGVTLYEPEELVLSARAGTPLAEIEALMAEHRQQLAFEPIDYGPIFGAAAGRGTLGGVLAANLSGPRRLVAGAARDHFLGFSAVSGRGERFKAGGRVVKNVTGYDLAKLAAGSWGTLAVLTDVTVKVLPRPETEESLLLFGLDDRAAIAALSRAMGSTGEVSGAAHLPAAAAAKTVVASLAGGRAVTALRLEGVPPSILHRRNVLQSLLKPCGELAVLPEEASRTLWRSIRDVTPFAAAVTGLERPLWRISTAPVQGPEIAARIAAGTDVSILYDWAGGLLWALLPPSDDAGAGLVRAAVAACGGHATLIRAPASARATVSVFEPPDPVAAMLTKRIKQNFDPQGVLNPGRMYAGV